MGLISSQIISFTIVYSVVYSFDDVIMIVWSHKCVQGIVSFQVHDEYLGLHSDSLWLFFYQQLWPLKQKKIVLQQENETDSDTWY